MRKEDARMWRERLRSTVALLCFGLGTLAFLIAIDRPEWFHLRPANGVAAAMSHAAAEPAPNEVDNMRTEPFSPSRI